jgi:protein CMS1
MSAEDDFQEPLLERLSATPEPNESAKAVQTSKKRKRGADVEQDAKKAAKKTKNKKAKADEGDELDIETGINKAFSHMDNQLLADYVGQRTRKYESELSSVELEDKYLPGT